MLRRGDQGGIAMNDLLADKDSSANEKEEDLEAGPSPVPEAGQDLSLFFQENTNEESKSVTKAANMTESCKS